MTNIICLSIIILILISPLIAQDQYFHNSSWNRSNRQNFMVPMHLYAGIPLAKSNHPTAPPIDTVPPINNNDNRYRNGLFTTRTTYFLHPMLTTTIQTNRRYQYFRRRNRSRIISTTTYPTQQHFGIVVNVYESVDIENSSSSPTQRPWWELTTTTTTTQRPWWELTTTTTTTQRPRWESTTIATQRPWWESTATTTQSFYERFPKLPSQIYRPPPPTVPRSFTASNRFTYPSTTITTTTTTTTTTSSQTSKTSNYFVSLIIIKNFHLI